MVFYICHRKKRRRRESCGTCVGLRFGSKQSLELSEEPAVIVAHGDGDPVGVGGPPDDRRAPHRFYITDEDLQTYGYTGMQYSRVYVSPQVASATRSMTMMLSYSCAKAWEWCLVWGFSWNEAE